jgi:antitoxin component of RelBE/YafQ-DinJ toxin-antitoxin module
MHKNLIFRVDKKTHEQFHALCQKIGMTPSTAMRFLVERSLKDKSFIPNIMKKNVAE